MGGVAETGRGRFDSVPCKNNKTLKKAGKAQMEVQRTDNPKAAGSSPAAGTKYFVLRGGGRG